MFKLKMATLSQYLKKKKTAIFCCLCGQEKVEEFTLGQVKPRLAFPFPHASLN